MDLVPFAAFVGADYRSANTNVATSQLVNWIVRPTESGTDQGVAQAALFPTPGLIVGWEGLDGPIRGLIEQDGRVFVVAGRVLYEAHRNGTVQTIGIMTRDDQPASLTSNGHGGHQLLIVSGGSGYIYDLSSGDFQQITDPAFPANVVMADFLDGYFLVMQATTSTFYLSALYNGLVWSPVQSGQVNASPDRLLAFRVIQRTLWLLGGKRSEVWVTTDGSFPLAPLPGGLIEYGLGAVWSIAECDGTLCFVGTNEQGGVLVLQNQGYGFRRISTDSEERLLGALPDLAGVRTYSYHQDGDTIYVIVPSTGPALGFNLRTGLWHQHGVWDVGTASYGPPRQASHVAAFGGHLVGDRRIGTVYWQSTDYGTDAGTPIRRVRQAPHINQGSQWVFGSQVSMLCETGLANPSDPSPVLSLSWSKDGGHTFSPPKPSSLGAGGDYGRLVSWLQAPGRFHDLVLRVTTTATTPVRVSGCQLRLEGGTGQR